MKQTGRQFSHRFAPIVVLAAVLVMQATVFPQPQADNAEIAIACKFVEAAPEVFQPVRSLYSGQDQSERLAQALNAGHVTIINAPHFTSPSGKAAEVSFYANIPSVTFAAVAEGDERGRGTLSARWKTMDVENSLRITPLLLEDGGIKLIGEISYLGAVNSFVVPEGQHSVPACTLSIKFEAVVNEEQTLIIGGLPKIWPSVDKSDKGAVLSKELFIMLTAKVINEE